MFNMTKILLSLFTLLTISSVCSAFDFYYFDDGDPADHYWSTPGNWDVGVPDPVDPNSVAIIETDSINTGAFCLIDETQNVSVEYCYIGWTTPGAIEMVGGTFSGSNFYVSSGVPGAAGSYFDMTGGHATFTNATIAHAGAVADVYMYLSGGVFEITNQLTFGNNPNTETRGHLEMEQGATLIIHGNAIAAISGYISGDFINHIYGARGRFLLDYDETNPGATTLRAFSDPNEAWAPSPVSGTTLLVQSVVLDWEPGDTAVSHELYFGTDQAAVEAADNTDITGVYQGVYDPNTYTASGLTLGETYYWRVDEVDSMGKRTTGLVWSFSVAAYEVIDGMETYSTGDIASNWVPSGGAGVDVSAFSNSGAQSLQLSYNNTAGAVTRTSAPMNWTDNSVESMSIYVHGDINNDGNDLTVYLELQDAETNIAREYYSATITELRRGDWEGWLRWDLDLGKFDNGGVDLTQVQSISIGYDGMSGGSGVLYFDDIRLYASRCLGYYSRQQGDFIGNDCEVDNRDFATLATYWGETGTLINAVAPSDANLIIWYKFDETSGYFANDSSGNGYFAAASDFTGHWDSGGVSNGCIEFDGTFSLTDSGLVGAFDTVDEEVTFSVWVNGDLNAHPDPVAPGTLFQGGLWPSNKVFQVWCPYLIGANATVFFRAGGNNVLYLNNTRTDDWAGKWNHYAFVKDRSDINGQGRMWVYQNGVLVATSGGRTAPIDNVDAFTIGALTSGAYPYVGKMDEFRMYDRALTQAEIANLAGLSSVYQPMSAGKAADANGDDEVGVPDLDALANGWLQDVRFP